MKKIIFCLVVGLFSLSVAYSEGCSENSSCDGGGMGEASGGSDSLCVTCPQACLHVDNSGVANKAAAEDPESSDDHGSGTLTGGSGP